MMKLVPFLLILGVAACSGNQTAKKPDRPVEPAPAPKLVEAPKPSQGATVSAGPNAPTSPIYFAFDSDELTEEARATLRQMAEYLKANAQATLTIEGHCDETGSSEYNLALGDRRARAALKYLKDLGIDQTRLNGISYGEKKPAVVGTDDDAHAKNRRGQFDLKTG